MALSTRTPLSQLWTLCTPGLVGPRTQPLGSPEQVQVHNYLCASGLPGLWC